MNDQYNDDEAALLFLALMIERLDSMSTPPECPPRSTAEMLDLIERSVDALEYAYRFGFPAESWPEVQGHHAVLRDHIVHIQTAIKESK